MCPVRAWGLCLGLCLDLCLVPGQARTHISSSSHLRPAVGEGKKENGGPRDPLGLMTAPLPCALPGAHTPLLIRDRYTPAHRSPGVPMHDLASTANDQSSTSAPSHPTRMHHVDSHSLRPAFGGSVPEALIGAHPVASIHPLVRRPITGLDGA